MKKLSFINKIVYAINVIVAIALLFSYTLPFVPPKTFSVLSVINLGSSFFVLINALFFLYWLVKLKKQLILSFFVLFIGYVSFGSLYKFSDSKNDENADDLKVISGVGPFIEEKLNSLGIYTYEQVGSFDKKMLIKDSKLHDMEHDWVEPHIDMKEQYKYLSGMYRPIGLKKALKKPKVIDLMLTGILPKYQAKGVTAVLFYELHEVMEKYGVTEMETTGIFETNQKVIQNWKNYEHIQHKRKRCWKKSL